MTTSSGWNPGVTPADVAWAAGIFEGEGCFRFTGERSDGKPKVAMMVLQMTDRDTMERFAWVASAGRVRGPVARQANRKPIYVVDVGAREDVRRLIMAFLPWLGRRRTAKAMELLSHLDLLDTEAAARAMLCKRGHPRTPENTYVNPQGYSACRECKREAGREWMRAKRANDPAYVEQGRTYSREYNRKKRAGSTPNT